jgi:Raf kinase inhibitor-like YbhB/YbcL family protein
MSSRMFILIVKFTITFLYAIVCVCAKDQQEGSTTMTFSLSSQVLNNNQPIPIKFTGFDKDISPPLQWTNAPAGTKTFVVICDDPDAPAGTWVHWVLYDVPANVSSISEGLPKTKTVLTTAKQGINDFGKIGYNGPMPPPGTTHRYFFKIYAIGKEIGLSPESSKSRVMKTIEGHILAQAEFIATYRR